MKKITILSISLLIVFFIPWLDVTIFKLSGFDIPSSIDKLQVINSFLNNRDHFINISYFIYLIPILSIFNIIKDILGSRNSSIEFFIGLISAIGLYIFIAKNYEEPINILGIGFYLTAIISILGIALVTFQKKDTSEILPLEKNDLLIQLERLHSLNEKEVITKEIYESEKNIILSKLKNSNNIDVNNPEKQTPKNNFKNSESKKQWLAKNKIEISFSILFLLSVSVFSYLYIQNRNTSELEYLKKYNNAYPSDSKLLESGNLKHRLLTLLGQEYYQILIDNTTVQPPIDITNDILFVSGCLPHSGGINEGALCINLKTGKITVGLLENDKLLIFSEFSKDPNDFEKVFYDWYTDVSIDAKKNKEFEESLKR